MFNMFRPVEIICQSHAQMSVFIDLTYRNIVKGKLRYSSRLFRERLIIYNFSELKLTHNFFLPILISNILLHLVSIQFQFQKISYSYQSVHNYRQFLEIALVIKLVSNI